MQKKITEKILIYLFCFGFSSIVVSDENISDPYENDTIPHEIWDYISPTTKYLDEADLAGLKEGVTLGQMIDAFGEPMHADGYAHGWPKMVDRGSLPENNVWKQGYWAFSTRRSDPVEGVKREIIFIASLKDKTFEIHQSLGSLVEHMTVDWPYQYRGELLLKILTELYTNKGNEIRNN